MLRFLNKLRRNYEAVYPVFISASLHRFTQWMNAGIFRAISRIPKYGLLKSMDTVNRAQFKNPKTAQIFNRFATYNGSNPYEAPGMLNIIAHLELNIGPYIPKGGMVSISNHSFEQLLSPQSHGNVHDEQRVEYQPRATLRQRICSHKQNIRMPGLGSVGEFCLQLFPHQYLQNSMSLNLHHQGLLPPCRNAP